MLIFYKDIPYRLLLFITASNNYHKLTLFFWLRKFKLLYGSSYKISLKLKSIMLEAVISNNITVYI